jgi:prepilin-type N-terminal cleavage/methylation domain-containing protein
MVTDWPRRVTDAGFTLIELLIATSLVLLIVAGMTALMTPAGQLAVAEPDSADMQQRLRVGAAALYRDVSAAGAGLDTSFPAGPLIAYLPPILPRRLGAIDADAPDVSKADVISVITVPVTHVQSVLSSASSGTSFLVHEAAGCVPGQPSCGFATGMDAMVFDAGGRFDLFTVIDVQGAETYVRSRGPLPLRVYEAGAFVSEVRARTYFIDRTTKQLRQYDTDQTDVPVTDGVIELQIEYFGTPMPPSFPKPSPGESNCLYDTDGNRLPGMATLAPGTDGLTALGLSMFVDGPWCGEGATRFDADLLRIRRVRITLGVEAASAARRGIGPRFKTPGTSRSALQHVADAIVSFDVAPPNLSVRD